MADELSERRGNVVGVRFVGSARVHFFAAGDLALDVGMWISCTTPLGERAGRVVIAPHQVLMSQLDGDLPPIHRVLSSQDVERYSQGRDDVPQVNRQDDDRLVGGLGVLGQGGHALSHENEQYQRAKQDLPRLGQRIYTPDGEGTVVSLQILKTLVTVRYTDPLREQTYLASELPGRWTEQQRETGEERPSMGPLTGHVDTA